MELKESWKEHPLHEEGKIELVPTEWLWRYWGRDVSPMADDGNGHALTLEGLWESLLEQGMFDPMIMRVGVYNRNFRLEAGNHRIQVAHQYGVKWLPVTVQLREECGPHVSEVMTDATHNFNEEEKLLVNVLDEEYKKPSEVFASLIGVAKSG